MSNDGDALSLAPVPASMFSNSTINTIEGGTFVAAKTFVNIQAKEHQTALQILHQHVALGAFHDAAERGDPPKCYPHTREAILKKIMGWIERGPENLAHFILWVYGPAGAGKTAIAQTIAELCVKLNLLAASFFFSRTAAGRNDISGLVATLTWQLIQSIPEMREYVLTLLERDPTIVSRTPATQMKALIIDPLNMISKEVLNQRPRFIIIDGLDECLDRPSQENILKVLAQSIRQLTTPIQFLIASRPELEIRDTFNSDILRPITHTLPLEHDYQSVEDIRQFLTSKFQKLHVTRPHLSQSWPPKADIDNLVEKSSGQFIYAATVIRYIESRRHLPEERLTTVLELKSSGTDTPFAALDALYLQIFSSVEHDQLDNVLKIFSALILIKKETVDIRTSLEELFGYRPGQLESVMGDMVALVDIPTERHHSSIRIYHASLPDFLLDPSRSRMFFLDPPRAYANLTFQCLRSYRNRWDRTHLARALECVTKSTLTSELVNMLLNFNPWQISKVLHIKYVVTMHGPAFLRWLEGQIPSSPKNRELLRIQFRNFDKWVLQTLRELSRDHQARFPVAMYICSCSYGWKSLEIVGVDVVFTGLPGIMAPNTSLDLAFWMTPGFADVSPPFRYLSNLFNDASRAAEFLVTETHFTNIAVLSAKLAFRVIPGKNSDLEAFESTTMLCLRLCLPRSSRALELIQLLRDHALKPSPLNDRLQEEREETAMACLKYIERCEASEASSRS